MKTHTMLALVAAATFSLTAHAHDCSGGAAGGMDATGNQCNGDTIVATDAALANHATIEARANVASDATVTPRASATSGGRSTQHASAARHTSSRKHRVNAG